PPHGRTGLRTMVAPLPSAPSWRNAAYALIRFPFGVIQLVLVTTAWSVGLALITAPTYYWALPGGGFNLGGHLIRSPGAVIAAVVAGVALLLASPRVTWLLAAADAAGRRAMPGTGPGKTDRQDR